MGLSDKLSAGADKAKGQAKETLGKVTDDDSMVAEGKFDKAKGEVKESVEKAKDKAKDLLDQEEKE